MKVLIFLKNSQVFKIAILIAAVIYKTSLLFTQIRKLNVCANFKF